MWSAEVCLFVMIKPLSASWLGQSCALSALSHLTSNHVLVKTANAGKETLKCEGEQREESGYSSDGLHVKRRKEKRRKGKFKLWNSEVHFITFFTFFIIILLLLDRPQGHYESE